ncbi:hypothetical protein ET445_03310 [Agromyces protaetiae]|uniref:Uncharacterized protein n=1 Tax=Agromyces protaetiae TaxID=2509455 RepID=A0A4P6F9E8_9MICO|nr:hypothetical protein [Agromyces protaetiae]QAY72512.1 hypothetical protein ET445_03310 [Agromyces protaetiae]
MTETVVIAAWNPWPLIFPVLIALAGVALSIVGTRRRSKPVREGGYVAFLVGALALAAMTWSLSGMWDSGARTDALARLGIEHPVYSGDFTLYDDALAPIAFTGERDGEPVRGVLVQVEGERWEVRTRE